MSQPPEIVDAVWEAGDEEAPLHGFQGDRGASAARRAAPRGLTIALSREAGARGGTIARLVGQRLGWQVYDQELLEYMTQSPAALQNLLDDLPPACLTWMDTRLSELEQLYRLSGNEPLRQLARLVLALGAQGEAVMIGRGAGYVLPRETTLNVRVVAPLPERIAYMSQWLRLSVAEATERVRSRDEERSEFVRTQFHRSPAEVHEYDLLLNTSRLGEETCADLIAQAARARWEQLWAE